MKKYLSTILILLSVLGLCGCGVHDEGNYNTKNTPTSIYEIAYDYDASWGYHIYLEENDSLVPFIVLSSNYNGNCLVMREHLLDKCISYNSPGQYGSYYNGSNVDQFLNNQYYAQLSNNLKHI